MGTTQAPKPPINRGHQHLYERDEEEEEEEDDKYRKKEEGHQGVAPEGDAARELHAELLYVGKWVGGWVGGWEEADKRGRGNG